MNKRGQFYIIAAVIIALIITGIAGYSTYSIIKSDKTNIKDISTNLKNEGPKIIDYGLYEKKNITELMENFTKSGFGPYFLYKTNKANVVFIYGNKTNLYASQYNTTKTGKITSTIGGGHFEWENVNSFLQKTKIESVGNELNVEILDKNYTFNMTEGEMFYFIIVQEDDGERYVEKN